MTYKHTPVLLKEVIEYLNPKPNQNYIDCTLGLGGHSKAILEKTAPKGKLLAIEQNLEGLNEAKQNLNKYKNRITYINDNFANLNEIIRNSGFLRFSGILFDLGLASWQIDEGNLGISFQKNEPLDMQLASSQSLIANRYKKITAEQIINRYSLKKLADIFYKYGDMGNSFWLAKKIIQFRDKSPITTTFELKDALQTSNPKILAPIFQALRIEVNGELNNLHNSLAYAIDHLDFKGRIVVISYHSGEDRIVKNLFRDNKNQIRIITKKPITPTTEEIRQNPRSRSAKMRVGEKI